MKNKKLAIFFLLPLVIFIWGMFLFKLFKAFYPVSTPVETAMIKSVPELDREIMPDTFSIQGKYRDPFLGTISTNQHLSVTNAGGSARKVVKIDEKINWPSVAYKGLIKNQKSHKQLAMIFINGKNNLMNSEDEREGLILKSITRDSVEVVFQNRKKWIKK
jgi:hypothetical protein